MTGRKVTLLFNGIGEEYTEGVNCDRIFDNESYIPVIKVVFGNTMKVFRGIPYILTIDKTMEHQFGHVKGIKTEISSVLPMPMQKS